MALVLGSGDAADRKAAALAASGATLRRATHFSPELLDGCAIAYAAGADAADQQALYQAGLDRGLPINVVDQPDLCSFFSPAVIDRDPITIAIGSGGSAPVLARRIRAQIEALLPDTIGRVAEWLERWKPHLRARHPAAPARRMVIERALNGPAFALALAGAEEAADAALARAIAAEPEPGMVFVVGTGPGEADLLTLRAHRLLGEADTLLHGPEIGAAILAMARRDASFLAWPKALDPLPELARLAATGQRVVWLRAGDPAADPTILPQLAALQARGVNIALVPGIAPASG